MADIEIKAEAQLSGFSLKDVLGDVDLTDAAARVKYGDSELSVAGAGKLDGSAVDIAWRELFGAKAPFRRRYDVKGTVPATLVAKAGFPSLEPYVVGPDRHGAALSGGDERHERGARAASTSRQPSSRVHAAGLDARKRAPRASAP